jgi:hypothetical protein
MDTEEHKKEFDRIIKENDLAGKADEIADFVVGKTVSLKDFSERFGMSEDDAKKFLGFIKKGIEFKEENIDRK